jgi:hypothetical protein
MNRLTNMDCNGQRTRAHETHRQEKGAQSLCDVPSSQLRNTSKATPHYYLCQQRDLRLSPFYGNLQLGRLPPDHQLTTVKEHPRQNSAQPELRLAAALVVAAQRCFFVYETSSPCLLLFFMQRPSVELSCSVFMWICLLDTEPPPFFDA